MSHAVLIIEDEETLAENIASYLSMNGYEAHVANAGASGLAAHKKLDPDVTLLDLRLPDMDGIDVLKKLQNHRPASIVIMMTAFGDVETAVEAMKTGASDFIRKPLSLDEVKILIDRTVEQERTREAVRHFAVRGSSDDGLVGILGQSDAVLELKEQVAQLIEAEKSLAKSAAPPVLITGATGTGKELVARTIHLAGPRRSGPFIEINCAALPSDLVESELFGHERGAFTDARDRKIGLIEAADGGTLFLDEIGEMSLATQAKILKVMEDRMVRRVGGTRARAIDVRFIAATNRNLEDSVAEELFREDLLFRLSVVRFDLPSLRDRNEDIIVLAEHFLSSLSMRYGRPVQRLSAEAKERLLAYSWPGNVRELRNVLERATLFSSDDVIQAESITLPSSATYRPNSPTSPSGGRDGTGAGWPKNADDLTDMELTLLSEALVDCDGNVSKVARMLHLTRDQVRYRMRKYGLNIKEKPPTESEA